VKYPIDKILIADIGDMKKRRVINFHDAQA